MIQFIKSIFEDEHEYFKKRTTPSSRYFVDQRWEYFSVKDNGSLWIDAHFGKWTCVTKEEFDNAKANN